MSRFSQYVEGELEPRAHQRLEAHEGICPECRRALQALRKLLTTLPGLREADPDRRAAVDRSITAVIERIQAESPPTS